MSTLNTEVLHITKFYKFCMNFSHQSCIVLQLMSCLLIFDIFLSVQPKENLLTSIYSFFTYLISLCVLTRLVFHKSRILHHDLSEAFQGICYHISFILQLTRSWCCSWGALLRCTVVGYSWLKGTKYIKCMNVKLGPYSTNLSHLTWSNSRLHKIHLMTSTAYEGY